MPTTEILWNLSTGLAQINASESSSLLEVCSLLAACKGPGMDELVTLFRPSQSACDHVADHCKNKACLSNRFSDSISRNFRPPPFPLRAISFSALVGQRLSSNYTSNRYLWRNFCRKSTRKGSESGIYTINESYRRRRVGMEATGYTTIQVAH